MSSCKRRIYKDPNTTKEEVKFDGLDREYVLHLPSSYSEGNEHALVIFLHGGKGTPESVAKQSSWIDKSDDENFILIFPKGENKHWNDGRGTTKSSEEDVDDVGFISFLIDEINTLYTINTNKVFVSGVSNGGFMSHRLACELSDKITAIASVVATLPKNQVCNPSNLMPVLSILGTEDIYVPYEGGEMEKGAGGTILSADETVAKWSELNGCLSETETTTLEDKKDDGTTVSIISAKSCSGTSQVILYKVIGGGHEWQGATGFSVAKKGDGHKCKEIDATDVVWDFFSQY